MDVPAVRHEYKVSFEAGDGQTGQFTPEGVVALLTGTSAKQAQLGEKIAEAEVDLPQLRRFLQAIQKAQDRTHRFLLDAAEQEQPGSSPGISESQGPSRGVRRRQIQKELDALTSIENARHVTRPARQVAGQWAQTGETIEDIVQKALLLLHSDAVRARKLPAMKLELFDIYLTAFVGVLGTVFAVVLLIGEAIA